MKIEIPGYRIIKILGKGGMATVYLAEQESFGRKVALKVMSGRLFDSQDMGERFMQEARIVSQLMHPNIVTVFDVGVHREQYYLSMEYVDGPELKSAQHGLSVLQKIRVIRDMAKALEYAASRGYIHRDIKPENIMLHGDGRAVLMDFGIARAVESDLSLTQTGAALGTPYYMSPEQANGTKVDIRSDIYSLGAVFYYLLTGEIPYTGDSAVAVCIKHINEPVPTLPEELQALQPILEKMMAKAVGDRFQTPQELYLALQNVLRSNDYDEAENIEWVQGSYDSESETKVTPLYSELANTMVEGKQNRHKRTLLLGLAFLAILGGMILIKVWQAKPNEMLADSENNNIESSAPAESRVNASEQFIAEESRPEKPSGGLQKQADKVVDSIQDVLQKTEDNLFIKRKPFAEQVAYYRERLQENPSKQQAAEALKTLLADRRENIFRLLSEGNFPLAEERLREAKTLFPESPWRAEEKRISNRTEIEFLLNKAQEALQKQRYDSPFHRNALHYYRKILALDQHFEPAQRGLKNIQNILVAQAQEEFVLGNYANAKRHLERALDIDPNHRDGQKLLANLQSQLEQPRTSDAILEKAQDLLAEGKLYSPAGNNAYEYYRKAVADPATAEAARLGLQRLKQELAVQVNRLLEERKTDSARAMLNAATSQLGIDGEVELLHFRVDEAEALLRRAE